jgi:hypothetical protein
MFAAEHFGLADGFRRAAIAKGGIQRSEIDAQPAYVPVNHSRIAEVFAKNKVRGEEILV